MKLIYTHENKILVENARNALAEQGIDSIIRNEYASGGMGELSVLETWPELWVHESHIGAAKVVIHQLQKTPAGKVWTCKHCGEKNEPNFHICWQCMAPRS